MEPLKLNTGSNFISFVEFQILSDTEIKIFLIVDRKVETCFTARKIDINSILGQNHRYEIVSGSGNIPFWFEDMNPMPVISDYIKLKINS